MPAECQRLRNVGGSTYYCVDTTNQLSDLPPLRAPHNFGICREWYEEKRCLPQFKEILADWGMWPGPPGYDAADRRDAVSEGSTGHRNLGNSVSEE
jgi:hypothetical protein